MSLHQGIFEALPQIQQTAADLEGTLLHQASILTDKLGPIIQPLVEGDGEASPLLVCAPFVFMGLLGVLGRYLYRQHIHDAHNENLNVPQAQYNPRNVGGERNPRLHPKQFDKK